MATECHCIRSEGDVIRCGPCERRESHYQAGRLDGFVEREGLIDCARTLLDAMAAEDALAQACVDNQRMRDAKAAVRAARDALAKQVGGA